MNAPRSRNTRRTAGQITKIKRAFRRLAVEPLEDRKLLAATVAISEAAALEGAASTLLDAFVSANSGGLARTGNALFGPDGNLYVASRDNDSVLRYDGQTGEFLDTVIPAAAEGIDQPWFMTFGPDNRLYVAGFSSESIVRYDLSSGLVDTFIAAGGALHAPKGMVFDASGNFYVSNADNGTADVNPNQDQVLMFSGPAGGPSGEAPGTLLGVFVSGGSGGLDNPNQLAFHGSHLLVTNTRGDSINRYDATTGAFVDVFVATTSGGLDTPNYLVVRPDGYLYVNSQATKQVLRYDAVSGAFAGVAIVAQNFTSGAPTGLDFDSAGDLYVANGIESEVLRFVTGNYAVFTVTLNEASAGIVTVQYATADGSAAAGSDYAAATGTVTFAPGETEKSVLVTVVDDDAYEGNETFVVNLANPAGATLVDSQGVGTITDNEVGISISDTSATEGSIAAHYRGAFVEGAAGTNFNDHTFGPDGKLYAAPGPGFGDLRQFDATTGEFVDVFATGLAGPRDIVFRSGELLIGNEYTDEVLRYDVASKTELGAFVTAGSGGIDGPHGVTFGPDANGDGVGELYVSGRNSWNVVRYDGVTGLPLGAYIASGSGGLKTPEGLSFDPSGAFLYVTSSGTNQILKYNAATGAFTGVAASTNLSAPKDVKFGSDGLMYVASSGNDRIIRFTAAGLYIDDFVPAGSGGMDNPYRISFGPDGDLYVSALGSNQILRFGTQSEAVLTVSLAGPSSIPVTVGYATTNGSASAGSDYSPISGTLTFAPGQTVKTLRAPTLDDATYEGNETFFVNLSNPSIGAAIVDGQGVVTIVENELPTKFYVVNDDSANRTYEYAAAGTAIENYSLNGGNAAPRGAASTAAGDKVWVVDANRNVYVYNTSGGLLGSWTAGTLAANAEVEGIATNGADVWIVDAKSDKVFKYTGAATRLSGSQNAASSFSLNSANGNPADVVTDGASLWVTNDAATNKVFKYTVAGGLLGSWTIDAANATPTGITIDPASASDIWIVDSGTDRVYQYTAAASRTSGSQSAAVSFALAAGNTNPQGIADPPVESTLESRLQPVLTNSRLKAVLQLLESDIQPEWLPAPMAVDDVAALLVARRKVNDAPNAPAEAGTPTADDEATWLPTPRNAAEAKLELELLDRLFAEIGG